VSALAFLIPDAKEAGALSPMYSLAAGAAARTERREGWQVALAYGEAALERERVRQGVGFADRSELCKLELQAEPDELARIIAAASGGASLELGVARRSQEAWWCPVTPARALVLAEPACASALRLSLESAAGPGATIVDVTCGLAAMSLLGAGCAELLARFCAIDVRPALASVGAFRPGSVARTPGYLLRAGEHELLVLVGWALGEYLWRVVADAAEHLGGGPVGAEALAELRERSGA
jgi:heterotetrameric sarcosine oxidase gamma subunit